MSKKANFPADALSSFLQKSYNKEKAPKDQNLQIFNFLQALLTKTNIAGFIYETINHSTFFHFRRFTFVEDTSLLNYINSALNSKASFFLNIYINNSALGGLML